MWAAVHISWEEAWAEYLDSKSYKIIENIQVIYALGDIKWGKIRD